MALVQTHTLFYLYEFYLVSPHCPQRAGWSAGTAPGMGSLQILPRGAARGNAPLLYTFASAPAHCYGSCGRRTFAQSLSFEYTYSRTAGIPAGICLGHTAAGPFCPLSHGYICHSVGGTKIKQFPISWPRFFASLVLQILPLVLDIPTWVYFDTGNS